MTAVVKSIGLGWTLGVDITGGTTYAAFASIKDGWKNSGAKKKDVPTTLMGDTWETFLPGQIDPGTVTFSIQYDGAHADTHLLASQLASTSVTLPQWQVTDSVGGHEVFKAYVCQFHRVSETDKQVLAEIELRISGDPGFKQS